MPSSLRHGYADNHGVRIHYLDSGPRDADLVPLVIVSGALGKAELYVDLIEELHPRRVISTGRRGTGRSHSPPSGYSFTHQRDDLRAILTKLGLRRFAMFAYSMGVPVALAAALQDPARLAGMILGDYPARYPRIPLEWVERTLMQQVEKDVQPYVVQATQAESAEHDLWDDLPALTCPVSIITGDQPGSLLDEDDTTRYLNCLPQAHIHVMPGAAHTLWAPDYDGFVNTLRTCLERFDRAH